MFSKARSQAGEASAHGHQSLGTASAQLRLGGRWGRSTRGTCVFAWRRGRARRRRRSGWAQGHGARVRRVVCTYGCRASAGGRRGWAAHNHVLGSSIGVPVVGCSPKPHGGRVVPLWGCRVCLAVERYCQMAITGSGCAHDGGIAWRRRRRRRRKCAACGGQRDRSSHSGQWAP